MIVGDPHRTPPQRLEGPETVDMKMKIEIGPPVLLISGTNRKMKCHICDPMYYRPPYSISNPSPGSNNSRDVEARGSEMAESFEKLDLTTETVPKLRRNRSSDSLHEKKIVEQSSDTNKDTNKDHGASANEIHRFPVMRFLRRDLVDSDKTSSTGEDDTDEALPTTSLDSSEPTTKEADPIKTVASIEAISRHISRKHNEKSLDNTKAQAIKKISISNSNTEGFSGQSTMSVQLNKVPRWTKKVYKVPTCSRCEQRHFKQRCPRLAPKGNRSNKG